MAQTQVKRYKELAGVLVVVLGVGFGEKARGVLDHDFDNLGFLSEGRGASATSYERRARDDERIPCPKTLVTPTRSGGAWLERRDQPEHAATARAQLTSKDDAEVGGVHLVLATAKMHAAKNESSQRPPWIPRRLTNRWRCWMSIRAVIKWGSGSL